MRVVLLCSSLFVVYTYFGYPVLIAVMSRVRPYKSIRAPWSKSSGKPISIVMAVHNGGALVRNKVEHLLTLEPELVKEIIIVSDGSTDETNAVLASYVDTRLKIILLQNQVGKAAALNEGIATADGEILLFVDVRPQVEKGALASLLENFADSAVGCVAGELSLSTDGHDATAAAVSGLYWRYEQWIRNSEAAWDSPVGVYGGFYAVRREAVVLMPNGTILDDMFQPLSIVKQGYRSVLDRSARVVDVWPKSAAGEFSRKVRTLAGNFQLVALAPWLINPRRNRLAFQLVSHKLFRLLVPYCFVLMLLSSSFLAWHSKLFGLLTLVQVAFWLTALLGLYRRVPLLHRIASPAGALLMLNAAAVVGLCKFLFTRGPLWKIWSPHPSSSASFS